MVFGGDIARAVREARSFARELGLPANAPHRLVRLADVLDENDRAGRGSLAVDAIELFAILDALQGAWTDHRPMWRLLAPTLRGPAQFDHQILMLATVRILRSWRNDAEPRPEGPGGDAEIHAPPTDVAVEVKAPRALVERASAAGGASPDDLVRGALEKSTPQRRDRPAVVLALAGFRVPLDELDEIARAWSRALTHRPTRAHVAAGLAITVGLAPADIPLRTRPRSPSSRPPRSVYEALAAELDRSALDLRVSIRVGRNGTYTGAAPVIRIEEALTGIRLPESTL